MRSSGKISGRVQYISLSDENAWASVFASLRRAAAQQAVELQEGTAHGPFRVFTKTLSERWGGTPGFDGKIEFPRFESQSQREQAAELTAFFEGRAFTDMVSSRPKPWRYSGGFPWEPSDDMANQLLGGYGIASASDQLLSVWSSVSTYSVGAAHHNHGFETFNFALTPRLVPFNLEELFADIDAALRIISERCIESLTREFWERAGERPDELSLDWITRGVAPELDNFASFTIDSKGLTLLFAPYHVAPYAFGTWEVTVSFFDLIDHVEEGFRPLLPLRSNSGC